ncbi:E3 SUMO-protein ligase NSE2-like [Anopheles nili]|uniref:E3 SUMO-protein ligase NSE2-like n=1 Tax=Anopheles nili TaxID=185578 RepID=UPI00237BD020|nr:E3 SUMO-protein ligase NSE2-like [Anopheles nili]
MNMLEANMRKVSDSVNNTVRLVAEFGDESAKDVKLYTELVKRLCVIDSKMNNHRKALAESNREQCVESFDRRYNAGIDKKNPQVHGHKRYKDFLEYANPLLNPTMRASAREQDSDADLIIEDNDDQLIDPITKRPLEVPVRNKQCNHVYEKHAIEEMLKLNPRTRCPVMGCAAQEYVQPKFLEIDVRLQQQLIQGRALR